jgi:hypothetical protein
VVADPNEDDKMTTTTTTTTEYWRTPRREQGQIVSDSVPQRPGRAESDDRGPLRLRCDASDRTWEIRLRGAEIAAGRYPVPSVAEARALVRR